MQTYFLCHWFRRKLTSANTSGENISVTSRLLFCCWPLKFTDRIRQSRTRATPREPAIILELELILFAKSSIETPKKISISEVCFLCKANVSSEETIKAFGKSAVAIHSLILRSTEVDLSVYVDQSHT